jgi:hypothetical protein
MWVPMCRVVLCCFAWLIEMSWQQTLIIHSNNNRGTETQQSTSDFDVNGNLLALDNIGTLNWHYNNTLINLHVRCQTDQ